MRRRGPDPDAARPERQRPSAAPTRAATLAAARAFWLAAPAMAWLMLFFLLPLLFVGDRQLPDARSRRPTGRALDLRALRAHLQRVRTRDLAHPRLRRDDHRRVPAARLPHRDVHRSRRRPGRAPRAAVPGAAALLDQLPRAHLRPDHDRPARGPAQRLLLVRWGILQEGVQLLFTPAAVVLGLVYGYLPFMVLPIYAAVERLDRRFVEAAHDLGANDWRAFWRVIWPLTLPGVVAGSMLVFIPAIGAFVTPDLMGGTGGLMIGNLVQSQFRGRGNVPLGSAISMVLLVIVFVGVLVYGRWGERREP
jgi:ABC-type sugar transport system permease subunit